MFILFNRGSLKIRKLDYFFKLVDSLMMDDSYEKEVKLLKKVIKKFKRLCFKESLFRLHSF